MKDVIHEPVPDARRYRVWPARIRGTTKWLGKPDLQGLHPMSEAPYEVTCAASSSGFRSDFNRAALFRYR